MHDLATLASRLRHRALSTRHRLALVLAGDAQWSVAAARACLGAAGGGGLWLSDRPLAPGCLPLAAGTGILGSEVENLVYDAQGGFDPDGFGAAVGALEGVTEGRASAVLAASIFHFGEFTIGEAKAHMAAAGIPVRLT